MNRKVRVLAEGAYGKVYEIAHLDEDGNDRKDKKHTALKRSVASEGVEGFSNSRELAVFNTLESRGLKPFPYALRLKKLYVNYQPMSDMSPLIYFRNKTGDTFKDDSAHFEFDLASGNLMQFLRHAKIKTAAMYRSIMYQMALGVKYLHSRGIVHRDIKPENFLVFPEDKHFLSGPLVKIADFGMSYYESTADDVNSPRSIMTSVYRPPEVTFESEKYNRSIDIWSLGCCFYELVSKNGYTFMSLLRHETADPGGKITNGDLVRHMPNRYPFPVNEEDYEYIKTYDFFPDGEGSQSSRLRELECVRDAIVEEYRKEKSPVKYRRGFEDEHTSDLLKKMLRLNPQHRASIDQVLAHPFFEEIREQCETDLSPWFQQPPYEVYTLQGKKRQLIKEVFEELSYDKEPQVRIFFHVFEFCSRLVCRYAFREAKFNKNFVLAVYYIFFKFENYRNVHQPEIAISERTNDEENFDGEPIDFQNILDLEAMFMLKTSGDIYRKTLYEHRDKPRIKVLWEFIWNYDKEAEYIDTYLEDFDAFYRETRNAKKETISTPQATATPGTGE